jgi:hypothetical protein
VSASEVGGLEPANHEPARRESELFAPSRPDIPTDDWDDQDLLTKDEARLRLERSAEVLRQLIERGGSPDDVAAALEQLRRIDRVLANL